MATVAATGISLDVPCCPNFAYPLYVKLSRGYDVCSVMPLLPVHEWRAAHRTARKRADRAHRRGYRFTPIRRHERVHEIYEINTSAAVRQGRPMAAGYLTVPSDTPLPAYPCSRHRVTSYGVEADGGRLVAYLSLYRSGQLCLVSQILGHARHLENEIMYLLWQGTLAREADDPDGFMVYNRHDSGTDGLRFFKERLGLAETTVEWMP